LLTELGHGLDVINMETTSTFTIFPDGSKGFVLNTPSDSALKWMPPTTPLGNIPKIGVVHAKLIVGGEYKGLRMFVVPLNNGAEMCKGISSKYVPFSPLPLFPSSLPLHLFTSSPFPFSSPFPSSPLPPYSPLLFPSYSILIPFLLLLFLI
jgi:hypothetical protein